MPKVWVTRDKSGPYEFWAKKPRYRQALNLCGWYGRFDLRVELCARQFHRLFPDVRLKGGKNSIVQVTLSMEVHDA